MSSLWQPLIYKYHFNIDQNTIFVFFLGFDLNNVSNETLLGSASSTPAFKDSTSGASQAYATPIWYWKLSWVSITDIKFPSFKFFTHFFCLLSFICGKAPWVSRILISVIFCVWTFIFSYESFLFQTN